MKQSIKKFQQDKNNFIMWFSLYAIVTFLSICILFGIYIYQSFHNSSHISQDIDGDYNSQEVNR